MLKSGNCEIPECENLRYNNLVKSLGFNDGNSILNTLKNYGLKFEKFNDDNEEYYSREETLVEIIKNNNMNSNKIISINKLFKNNENQDYYNYIANNSIIDMKHMGELNFDLSFEM